MENKSESKNNLNESTMPLLDEADAAAKEKIEMKDKSEEAAETVDAKAAETEAKKKAKEEEKERKRKAKEEEDEKKKAAKEEKEKKKAEEKELKKKQLEEKKQAKEAAKSQNGGSPSCPRQNPIDQFSVGANLLQRDGMSVNEHVNVNFEDLMGEVDAAQGFDGVYRFSVGVFEFVRFWFYRLVMPVFALPFAIVWALVFGVLTVFSVWVLTPAFRVLDIVFYFVHRFWNALIRTFLDPIFSSIALARTTPAAPLNKTPDATHSGRSVYRQSAGYAKVAQSESVTFTKNADGEEVALNIEN